MYGVCGVCARVCVTTSVISPDGCLRHVPLHTQGTGVRVCVVAVVCVVVISPDGCVCRVPLHTQGTGEWFCVVCVCEVVVCVLVLCVGLYVRCECGVCVTTVVISPDGCVCHVLLHTLGTGVCVWL